jgi:hypothetical protein
MLESLFATSHPKLLGIARIEIALGDIGILQFLAEELGEYTDPMAVRMLKELRDHADLVVRTKADLSLAGQRAKRREMPAQDEPAVEPSRFYRAYVVSDEYSGHYSLVYAVRSSVSRLFKFMVVLLDRWDRGVIDCWGGSSYTLEQFQDLLDTMSEDFSGLPMEQINKPRALTLLHNALDLNRVRGHAVPLEMFVWIHLIESQRFRRDADVPVFGGHCSICLKPIHTGPRTPPPFALGDWVVCHRCARSPLDCPICGGSVSVPDGLIASEDNDGNLDLRCPHCFESFGVSE